MKAGRWHPLHPRNLAALVAVVVLVLVARDVFWPMGFRPSEDDSVVVLVARGQSVDGIARQLRERGLIKSTFAFSLLARSTGVDRVLKAGQYRFQRGESVLAILRKLARGMSGQDLITVPEGLTLQDIASLFERRLEVDAERFLDLAADTALMRELGVPGPTFEGYLFPAAYAFLPGTDPAIILRRMVSETQRVLAEELARGGPVAHELSPHEILTLASIVEAEAARADERERIAAVYLNRLRRGMRLQADPTVAYALGGYRARLYYSDLKVESPYNTYRNEGLPPGPIGNPGRAAIAAVLNPRPGSRELFFVSRGDGTHVFSETGEAHEAARLAIKAARSRSDSQGPAAGDSAAADLNLPAERAGLRAPADSAGR